MDYSFSIAGKFFKYLFSGIFIVCKHFSILFLIIFVVNFASLNIFYVINLSCNVDNVKIVNGPFSLTIMAEGISNYGQEVFLSVSVITENTKSLDYILWNYLILILISFCANIFCENRILNFIFFFFSIFVIFLFLQSCRVNQVTEEPMKYQ